MQIKGTRPAHIAVVGAGFTGMVCALRLLRAGYKVTLLESEGDIGGLTTGQDFGSFSWDRFYHCILTSDKALLDLVHELGLDEELRWTKTEVGLFSHGALHKMTGPVDLLRYPHLPLYAKLRLALMTLYVSKLKDGLRLERLPLGQWTRRVFGRRVYEQIWEPLLRCKLGEMRRYASAAFLWGTIVRLASTRDHGPDKQEKLGYVHGGYRRVFEELKRQIISSQGSLCLGAQVRRIEENHTNPERGAVSITTQYKNLFFDGVILTVPNKLVAQVLKTTDAAYKSQLEQVMYLGMICTVLVLKRRLSPFYVTNVAEKIGFTGVIEMTNLIDPAVETKGRHLVYLPRYTSPDDPLFTSSEEAVWQHIWPDLNRIFPDLAEHDIEERFVFRERNVQPVPTIDYSNIRPQAQTPVPYVYLANTAQIINNTLNNNAMASIAQTTCKALMACVPTTIPVAASMEFEAEAALASSH